MAERGLWLFLNRGRTADKVTQRVTISESFTTTVTASAITPRKAELVLVSLDNETISYVGIAAAGRLVATDKKTVGISHLVRVEDLDIHEVAKRLPRQYSRRLAYIVLYPQEVERVSPKLWTAILLIIGKLRPKLQSALPNMKRLIEASRSRLRLNQTDLQIQERDAIVTALEVWGGHSVRKRILRDAALADVPATAPFLSRLRNSAIREDAQIIHDQNSFPGMNVVRRYQIAAVTLESESDRLTIINANRTLLEETLGVDLIYYNHRYDSFVLVQYKRMREQSGGEPAYWPDSDSSHASEIKRMLRADQALRDIDVNVQNPLGSFRLSERPFFVKLVEPKSKDPLDPRMVSGMYLPLKLWRTLLKSDIVKGARGGRSVGWRSCPRRLTNTEFTSLVRGGWIGSTAERSEKLTQIIHDVLEAGRMLVLAVSSRGPNSRDYSRDDIGRFTSEDDPFSND